MPALRRPSAEVIAAARALVADPSRQPVVDDPILRAAVREVRRELDDYDRELIARVSEEGADPSSREGLELALAHRIALARLELARGLAELADEPDDGPSSPTR